MPLLACILAFFAIARAAQIPLHKPLLNVIVDPANEWDINAKTDTDSTGQYIFDGIASLMQRWTHTRYRNGHSIVPGTIAPNTLLYHGRRDNKIPDVPDWVATDPEHSQLFCHDDCWHLTLVATRPLKILYFDGSAAAKMADGPLDSQDIVLFGEVRKDGGTSEWNRIAGLCAWGKQFGLDGFVRMEMDFEIMLCDFSAGVEVVSMLNLSAVSHRGKSPPPPERTDSEGFEVVNAGSWHNPYPGEVRIQVDASRMVSFYDTLLVPSLVGPRRGQARWQHRLVNISQVDAAAYKSRLEDVLRQDTIYATGVDWPTLARVIVDRFGDRLELLAYILNSTSSAHLGNATERAEKAHVQLRLMIQPYALLSAIPANMSSFIATQDVSWASPIYKHCATAHTSYAGKLAPNMAPSELTVLAAVRNTTSGICRTVARMWAHGVHAGLDWVLGFLRDGPPPSDDDIENLLMVWRKDVTELMGWLDWSIWAKCRPACNFEEICYMPTWPFFHGRWPGRPRRRLPSSQTQQEETALVWPDEDRDDWQIPQPRCVRRIKPYGF
ncbi:hypothetical protein HGRIS_000975 [Hohenbuehelia grisea]|uniref:Uncharacterized protein n=1 Tax=Hohenbuehelia grisea TaxID=104357 RepID=A0ABR3IQB1_9AGAR